VRQINDVHPAASGYRQLADSIYGWMKGVLAK
jgi:lysophospholipase L1-like esterase